MKTNKKIGRLMVYIFTPLIFMIIGYIIAAMIFSPFLDVIHAAGNLIINRDGPTFSLELYSIFDADAADEVDVDAADEVDADAVDEVIEKETERIIHVSEITLPYYGNHYAEIRNRRIGLQAPVYFGDSYEILRFGVGHSFYSLLPGFGGTILMAGHNTTHFLPFQDVVVGDVIELQTNYGHFEYEVVEIEILHVDDAIYAFDLGQTEKELLVMYTCYPFDVIGLTRYRMFVFAEKISGPVIDIMAQ